MAWEVRDNPCLDRNGNEKRKWATEQAAIFVARQDQRRDGEKRWTYLCPSCLKHHTTKVNPRSARKRRRSG